MTLAAVAACNTSGSVHSGDWTEFTARILDSDADVGALRALLHKKFGWQLRAIEWSLPLRGLTAADHVGIELTPCAKPHPDS